MSNVVTPPDARLPLQIKEWIGRKWCFVTLGVSLNMSGHGLAMGFSAILLPNLRKPDSSISIDDSSGSWIAAILGFALVVGNFIVPSVMANFGRRNANVVSVLPMITGWFVIVLAHNVPTLLVARFLQGIAMGMTSSLGPVLIGEYTSPKNRGAFLMTISLAIAIGVLIVHTMGSFMTWKMVALVCAFIAFVDIIIILFSPESPSYLADQGKYQECREAFRWLRGDVEEDELQRLIDTNIIIREAKSVIVKPGSLIKSIKTNLTYFSAVIKKKEFYKPIIIMIHLYILQQWSGGIVLAAYAIDVFYNVVGTDVNIAVMVIAMGIQRIISNSGAVFVIRKVKRRTMLFFTVGLNLAAFLAIAGYVYAKNKGILPFDHASIGVLLIHLHMFSIATGTIPLPFIIAGELFPLEYRSLAGGISVLFLSINLFFSVKTVPLLFKNLGIHGAYCIYAAIVGYCLVVAWKFLPETKDRTLQEIEDEFRGKPLSPEELKSAQSLLSLKYANIDRRCSTPALL